ncbi:MAG TPA: galactose-1-phosphate uridylyltransferase [Planctomycetaceae bacterium]|nr:galactose-1-phosphate uridylyltransferase [Planctomycetaceae bacterium]
MAGRLPAAQRHSQPPAGPRSRRKPDRPGRGRGRPRPGRVAGSDPDAASVRVTGWEPRRMPHLRVDHTTSDWVVFAPLRKLRPHAAHGDANLQGAAKPPDKGLCPFCPGNEGLTPREIYAVRGQHSGPADWRVRVVPNKFPALMIEEDQRRHDEGPLFWQIGGCGAHEVVIESPEHDTFLGQQPLEQIQLVLETMQQRYRDLMRDRRFQAFILFKNHGESAGTSLQHPHWQLIATPVVPRLLRLKHIEATEYFDRTGECLYCVLVREELSAEARIVAANEQFAAFVPYAAHAPFETWIVPRRHEASFHAAPAGQLRSLAEILRNVLLKLYAGLDDPDFNLTIDLPPRGDEDKAYFLWHVRILPRLTTPAGFELGSGMSINTVLPEEAASFLRYGNGQTTLPERPVSNAQNA